MASLRNASPRLRNYFKEHYIPQVCEALLCGLLVTCPKDPLKYLEKMIILIMENGLEHIRWDMCIDPSMRPMIRRLSETYLEQLFGLDDQLMTPELMIKACTFYTGNLVKTHFCTWRDITIPPVNESEVLAKKLEIANNYNDFRCKRYLFSHWHFYVKDQKERLKASLARLQQLFYSHRLIISLSKWKDKARQKCLRRENKLLLEHEIQLNKWKSKQKINIIEEEFVFPEENVPEPVSDGSEFDISLLPESAILKDESMKYISESCPGVLYLNLSNTSITNRTMRLLPRHFHNLQNLSLAYCRNFTDKGLQYLSLGNGCHKLLYLDLSGCTQISVKGFRNIANSCTGIMHLTINDMPTLTDNCVKALVEKCSRITSVVFIGAPHISDCSFKALSTCNLRKIRFEGNKRITDACFKYIDKTYPNISHIYMSNCRRITDGSLKSLSPLKHLTVLNLTNCIRLGDSGLRHFLDGSASTKIRELNLSNCTHLSDASLYKLSDCCPNLNYLSLRNCVLLTNIGVDHIVNIFSLLSIDLSGTVISNEALVALSRHKKLKELSLSECYNITDAGIQAFCKGSLILEHLDVSYCSQLSSDIIKALAIYCTNLTFLSIAGCPMITDSAMEILSAKCHYLHILDVSGCVLLTDKMLQHLQRGCKQLRILKMQYCTLISQEAAKKMSSVVQQQEYKPDDPPLWFGYDREGKPLEEQQNIKYKRSHLNSLRRSMQ
ncbi:F-box and leucine-rich repeat protein 13 isoform X4 [Erinaceus europaeus]|uniref:F-box and leucine-rich repeat protein 13 isoform X4 n=1 Tax=Erinaceus europaeus TaxID=9365 RepID=A0ABM3XU44_ERIEU|nr:F-box and leucine-rich repeat protein 13 isoform X4 [Erinaceus europaeus]